MVFTNPDKPQIIEIVTHCIFICNLKSQTKLEQASLKNEVRNKLWAEAVRCANAVNNLT